MKASQIFLFILITLTCSLSAANELRYSSAGFSFRVKPQTNHVGGHFISFCTDFSKTNEKCTLFPLETNLIFSGSIADWDYFFDRCSQLEDINLMSDVTMAIATLASLPAMGLWKTIAAEVAVGYVPNQPYKDLPNQDDLEVARGLTRYMILGSGKAKLIPSKHLLAYETILKTCSSLFKESLINKAVSECIHSCHQGSGVDEPLAAPSPSFSKQRRTSIQNSDGSDVREIEEYLNRVSR